jgi:hypothetical protein
MGGASSGSSWSAGLVGGVPVGAGGGVGGPDGRARWAVEQDEIAVGRDGESRRCQVGDGPVTVGYPDWRPDNDVAVLDAMLLKVVSLLKAILLVCVRILLVLLPVLFVILNK